MNDSTCVVRLSTSAWHDRRGLHIKRSLTVLRRQSGDSPILLRDADDIGATEVAERIVSLDMMDGVYRVVPCNEHRDWETGCIEDYDYRLEPVAAGEVAP